jgi:uncharacterized RDD family membrane protein YckC
VSYVPPPAPQRWHPQPPPIAPNGQPLASFTDRLIAYLIDSLVLFVISLLWLVPIMGWWIYSIIEFANNERYYTDVQASTEFFKLYIPMLVLTAGSIVLGLLATYLYFVEYQRGKGQTVGKRAMKVKIIPVDPAGRLTRSALVKRWGVFSVGGALVPMLSLIDGLWQLWDKPLQQCLHDKAAATVVVKTG